MCRGLSGDLNGEINYVGDNSLKKNVLTVQQEFCESVIYKILNN